MPIKINLLADQIAAEELRRKDPVKRAILVSVLLVGLVLFYSLMLQLKVAVARSEMGTFENRLNAVEETSKQVKADRMLANDIERKSEALDRYASNRFLWGSTLDALQRTLVPNIRLTAIQADQRYTLVESKKFLTTNVTVTVESPGRRFGFWKKPVNEAAVMTAISNQLKQIVKKYPFTTNHIDFSTKIAISATNAAKTEFTAKVEFTLPTVARENISLQIMGRDYAPGPGALDEFTRKIAAHPFFRARLREGEGGGINTLERPPQPRIDPGDPGDARPFVPFTIECVFKDRLVANE
jgi:hypothetical protein